MLNRAAALILAFVLSLIAGCAINPITGEEELMFISPDQDIEIGKKYAPEIEKEMGGRIGDEALQNYVDSVGQKIARVCHRPNLDYHFVALDHESTNAFALPGGYLFITRGMLEKLQTEAQLAGILSHEVVHVVARDTANAMSKQIGLQLLMMAVAFSKPPPGAMRAADVTRQIIGLKYSRTDERQADLAGVDYMVRAGYNPNGMVETMQILQNQPGPRPPEFFSTHPSPKNRTDYLARKIQRKQIHIPVLKVGKQDYRQGVLDRLGK
ncbi:MAG: M48 family metalloprotease [Planctomycetota bacterium]